MRALPYLVATLLSSSLSVAPKGGAVEAVATNHEGVWKAIAAVMDGARVPQAVVDAITLTIKGDHYEVTVEGEKQPDRGICTFDATANPKRMTINSLEGPNQGKTFLAIYEMKSDGALRVCYDLSGKEFPKTFAAPKGTALYLVGYRRKGSQ
jgi:uncharacterized protein (TIGR03067 family)